jgi:uncharacterized protein YecE (DUF72 family)
VQFILNRRKQRGKLCIGVRLMNFYVGTSGYSYPKWKGIFYPKDLPSKGMLRYYGENFRSVESNSTFRGMPEPEDLKRWAADVPADFKFALKAPQRITHMKRLKDSKELVSQVFRIAATLKKRLGPVLFQLPPNFKKDSERLSDFLDQLPVRSRAAFEFRHESWFDDEIFELLKKNKVALCIAEAEGELEVPFIATADWGYLRLRREDYSDADLKAWVKKVKKQDWSDAFVYFRHEDTAKGPKFAKRFVELAK